MQEIFYDAPGGKVEIRLTQTLGAELRVVCNRKCNVGRFIIFHTVMLHQACHVSGAQAVQHWITKRLDAWGVGQHQMIVKEMYHTCKQYLSAYQNYESEDKRAWTFNSLVPHGKL